MNGSGLSGAYLQTPPPDNQFSDPFQQEAKLKSSGYEVDAWMEVWDYAGGASFRAFVANDGKEKSLFIFFDIQGVMGRDLKKAYVTSIPSHYPFDVYSNELYTDLPLSHSLMALIELADGPLDCSHIITCIDRRIPIEEAMELSKSLQWVGFEMTTLDHWAHELDITSRNWMFMGMEL